MPYYEKEERFMALALAEARKALALGEVPVGAVVVLGEQVIGRGYNRRETDHSVIEIGRASCRERVWYLV